MTLFIWVSIAFITVTGILHLLTWSQSRRPRDLALSLIQVFLLIILLILLFRR